MLSGLFLTFSSLRPCGAGCAASSSASPPMAARRRGSRGAGRRADELAAIEIQLLVGDFRAANIRGRFDQHGQPLDAGATALVTTREALACGGLLNYKDIRWPDGSGWGFRARSSRTSRAGGNPAEIQRDQQRDAAPCGRIQPSRSQRRAEVTAGSGERKSAPSRRIRRTKSTSSIIGSSAKPPARSKCDRRTNNA